MVMLNGFLLLSYVTTVNTFLITINITIFQHYYRCRPINLYINPWEQLILHVCDFLNKAR